MELDLLNRLTDQIQLLIQLTQKVSQSQEKLSERQLGIEARIRQNELVAGQMKDDNKELFLMLQRLEKDLRFLSDGKTDKQLIEKIFFRIERVEKKQRNWATCVKLVLSAIVTGTIVSGLFYFKANGTEIKSETPEITSKIKQLQPSDDGLIPEVFSHLL